MIVLFILYLICSGIYFYMGISTLSKDVKSKTNKIFFTICVNLSFWAFTFALMTASTDALTATFFRILATFSWSLFYCQFLYFVIFLTKKESFLKKPWQHLVLFLPAVISIYIYFFNPITANDIVRISYGWAFLNPNGRSLLWDYFFNVYYISYMVIAVFLLWEWGKNTKVKREKKQSKVILYPIIAIMMIGSITDVLLPLLGMKIIPPLTIIFILLIIGGIWFSMIKYRLMNLSPKNVVLDVLKIMNEGLIILDQDGIIESVNKGAQKLLGYGEKELKGKSVNALFLKEIDLTMLSESSGIEIEMVSKHNVKFPVLVSYSVLRDEFGDKLGIVFTFQSIFEIKQIQNKLKYAYDTLEKRVEERTYELSMVNEKLENEIQARIAKEEEIKKLAFIDQLTGLPNRRFFNDRLNQAILHAVKNENFFAVLFLDLDGFKMINDTMGHAAGDELLKKVSKRLTNIIRKSDFISRVGGDEFLILLNEPTCKEYIKNICECVINSMKEPFEFSKNEIYINTSIGVSIYPEDGQDVETLVKNADIAMYKAKENGKGIFELCNSQIKSNLDEVMKLTNDLYRALEYNELELYYQPQVDIISGRIVGLEALIRWNHPKLGRILPNIFIPIAEKTGLIVIIGEWVLRTACAQNKAWQDSGFSNLSIAVNISVIQILSNKIIKQVSQVLLETGLNPMDLELEITENIFMKDINYVIDVLQELKNLNVRIALDDFGIEYSALSYLKQLPIDRIKIAKSFIDGISKNISDESIISAIIILGKKLGLSLIAEGVETKEQLQFLKAHKCDEIQGFYYYKAMNANEIEKLLLSTNAILI